ncbi:hypothetical protein [Paraburkholderia oxyphila]|uniref:hypothetical protein n=1 Tax=Paraburkholderia oxyphila TaxID=614212 RepID=UPI000484DE3B|nr:hypothetical protein [Paraburkholderia oxyphila]
MTAKTTRTIKYSMIGDIRKGDLYALLSVCTDHDLKPLLSLIKDRVSSSIESDDEYKKSPSQPSRYYRAIGDEIRRFGGNTMANTVRGGGPDYREIVGDVCKRFGVPFDESDIVKGESALLNLYLDVEWTTLPHSERDAAAERARAKVLSEATKFSNVVKGNAAKGPLAIFGLPGVPALTTLSLADPAYRVTAPCVLHIAYVRRQVLESIASNSTAVFENAPAVPRSVTRSATLTVSETGADSLVSLTRISDPGIEDWPRESSDAGISRLSPLFQAVPSLAAAQNVASNTYMEVVINGPLLTAKGKEGYRLITMIDGKPSHGTLLDPSSLSNIVNAGALLQVASVALGQKHLADIKRELNELKTTVKSIEDFQQNGRFAEVSGIVAYLEQVAPSVMAGEAPEGLSMVLEMNEVALLRDQGHLQTDIGKAIEEIAGISDPDTFGTGGIHTALKGLHARLERLCAEMHFCIRARAAVLQLAVTLGLSESLKTTRLDNIRRSLHDLREDGPLIARATKLMRQRAQALSAVTNTNSTISQRKLELLALNQNLIDRLKLTREDVERELDAAIGFFRQQVEPVRLILRLDGERIIGSKAA